MAGRVSVRRLPLRGEGPLGCGCRGARPAGQLGGADPTSLAAASEVAAQFLLLLPPFVPSSFFLSYSGLFSGSRFLTFLVAFMISASRLFCRRLSRYLVPHTLLQPFERPPAVAPVREVLWHLPA